nr:MAG TPA: hypothetical protein [Caudoviricetes sp.]
MRHSYQKYKILKIHINQHFTFYAIFIKNPAIYFINKIKYLNPLHVFGIVIAT